MVLITGANSGLGYEFSKLFAKENNELFLVGRNEEKLKNLRFELKDEFDVDPVIYVCDLTDEYQVKSMIDYIELEEYSFDYIINNAGVGSNGLFYENELKSELDMINTNIKAVMTLTHFGINNMKKYGIDGKILNVSSVLSAAAVPNMSVYAATKSFITSFTQSVNFELKKDKSKIFVAALLPGATATNFAKTANSESTNMFKRVMSPDQVALKALVALKHNTKIIVPGFQNKISILLLKVGPKTITNRILYNISKVK